MPCSKSGHLCFAGDMPRRLVNYAWFAISPSSLIGESRRVRRASTKGSQFAVQVRLTGDKRPSPDAF